MAFKVLLFFALIIQCIFGLMAAPVTPSLLIADNHSSVARSVRASGSNMRVLRRPLWI